MPVIQWFWEHEAGGSKVQAQPEQPEDLVRLRVKILKNGKIVGNASQHEDLKSILIKWEEEWTTLVQKLLDVREKQIQCTSFHLQLGQTIKFS